MDPTLAWLALAGLFAGFVDSIVGGGGIITLPALLSAGLPPHTAVATNKIAGTGASSIASVQYLRAGLVDMRLAGWAFPFSVLLGILGAAVVLRLPPGLVTAAIAVVVIGMTSYVLARPTFGQENGALFKDSHVLWIVVVAIVVGFYDGVLGPGTGNLLLFGIVATTGMGFRHAAAHGRVLNFGSNIGALGYFVAVDAVLWLPGLAMAVGTVTGGYVGSHVGIKHGAKWIRPLFVAVAAALVVRMLVSG